jgi:hypothetical protein
MDVGKKNREFIEEKVEVIFYSRRIAVFWHSWLVLLVLCGQGRERLKMLPFCCIKTCLLYQYRSLSLEEDSLCHGSRLWDITTPDNHS